MLQVFSSGCCKSKSGYCICFYGYTHKFQKHVSSVSSVFRRMLQVFYLDVAYVTNDYVANVCSECFVCFKHMLQ